MQAYKLKGKVNGKGNLIVTEPVPIPAGEVEVIILQVVTSTEKVTESQPEKSKRKSRVKAFEGLFENVPSVPPDFDPYEATWEALEEKYNRLGV